MIRKTTTGFASALVSAAFAICAATSVRAGAATDGKVYDVCVVGGGTAGVPAAICAAKAGAKVLLVEQGAQLGGTMTSGGVNFPGLFHAWGRQVVAGPGWDLCTNAVALAGGSLPDFKKDNGPAHWLHQVSVPVPLYAALAEEAVRNAGAEILYYTTPVEVRREGAAWRVRLSALGEEEEVRARQIVDATGSASVAAKAGARRLRDAERQPGSYAYHLDLGCRVESLDLQALEQAAMAAKASGELKEGDYRLSFDGFLRKGGDVYNYVNGADGSTAESRTAANLEGRASMLRMYRFLKRQKGLENVQVVAMATECGVRETYRVEAETMVSVDDYVSGRVFDDALAYAFYPVDLHREKTGVAPRHLERGVVATIPLSAMIPKGVENVLVAGRAIGSDREANSGLRVQASCMAMGQAAGVVAALAAARGVSAASVDLAEAREVLRSLGHLVPEAKAVRETKVERVFRTPRHARGNTSLRPVQPIDQAAWIAHPDDADPGRLAPTPRAVRYRCRFASDGSPLAFDVTGDNRFLLMLDGAFVARGPHRGSVENWTYQSYRVALPAGEHVLDAVVWSLGGTAPIAQLSYRPGFCLKAEGAYDAALTTGRGKWTCGAVANMKSIGKSGGAWGVGDGYEIVGADAAHTEPTKWTSPVVVRDAMGESNLCGLRQAGWMLFPTQLPDQIANRVRPGRFVSGGEMKFPLVVPAGETRTILWDLDRYVCAYPEAVVSGGSGGSLTWKWAEALRGPSKDPKVKGGFKGNRAEWKGKTFDGFGDRFVFDGRDRAVFQPPWFRCGRWCELTVKAGAEPVVVDDLALVETRYPLECETAFETPDDPALADVQRICARAMQMCCHEMLFDCPFYEQQMYPGDTRVQLNVISAMTSDDRIIRRAIDLFALNRRDDGNVPFNFPTTGTQDGASYTLCYLGMYADYVMNHANRAWLKARLPAMTDTVRGFELYERADGVIANLPGWTFLDWVPSPDWVCGWAPGARNGGASAEANLLYLAALQGAARVEAAFGNAHLAAHWSEKAAKLKPAIVKTFFDKGRGLFASDEAHAVFSEHAQCLALLTDVFEGAAAQALFEKLISAKDLCPASVYFSYYLFETYFKFRRADLFLKRLDLWKGYVKLGATTCLEEPEYPGHDSRSDCHAWGSHPLWFLRTGVAGIRSDAPFFERVRIAPQPGGLSSFRASYPHPSGKMIEVDLKFDGDRATGSVTTPVPGVFVYGSQTLDLAPGTTKVGSGE